MLHRVLALIAAVAIAAPAAAGQQYELGTLTIQHPWSRPTTPTIPVGVAYLSINNRGNAPDALISASSPVAARVDFHQTTIVDGMARMRQLQVIEIVPGTMVKIEPGGIHLMLMGLQEPLIAGKSVPLTLEFRVAGRITVDLKIESPEAAAR